MIVTLIVIAVIVVLVLFIVVGAYNKLVALDQRADQSFADIDVQLKQRQDLIPNLVETVKGYASHERGTLDAVTAARAGAVAGLQRAAANPGDAEALKALGAAEGAMGSALARLNVAVEAYPELKASQNMMQLSEELASTENRVAFSRQAFNDAVLAYNTYRQSFPNNVLAARFGHASDAAPLEFAEPREQLEAAPKVSF